MSTTPKTSRPLPRPLHLVHSSTYSQSSPLSPSVHVSPLSASSSLKNAVNEKPSRPTPRRQSSISYNTSSSSPRSPAVLKRHSIGGRILDTTETTIREESENIIQVESRNTPRSACRETEPITLAEKHADLLRFIAQKEAKCLELRTQLAQHEADLLVLKRKWERIVSKGIVQPTRPGSGSTYGASEVIEGIRGGVQSSFEKVLAVLEPGAVTTTSQQSPSASSSTMYAKSDVPPTASKRISMSAVSTTSTQDQSSLTGSRSSSGSLFDDVASLGDQSCLTEEDENISNITTEKPANIQVSKSISSPLEHASSSKTARPLSINLSQLPSLTTSEALMPLGKQMSNWIPPSINKRWEELKGNETISKQSKRASVLFNDVFAALSSPSQSTTVRSFKPEGLDNTDRQKDASPTATVVNDTPKGRFGSVSNPKKAAISSKPCGPQPHPDPWLSLLDDDQSHVCPSSSVLQPQIITLNPESICTEAKKQENREDSVDDEEWNW